MTITEACTACKGFFVRLFAEVGVPRDVLIVIVLILASSASFALGYLAGRDAGQGSAVSIEIMPPAEGPIATSTSNMVITTSPQSAPSVGQYVASKNGTKYYLPTCAGAKRISEANKVWFSSVAAAVKEGYAPAANCPGL